MNFFRLFLSTLILSLVGCASAPPPPLNYSVPNVGLSKTKHAAEVKSITVSIANQTEATGRLYSNMSTTPELWRSSIEQGINSMNVFSDEASQKVNIAVKILKFDPSKPGADMTSFTEARYEIVDRKNGDIIYSQNFSTSGKVLFSENMLGVARIIESVNIAVRNNIGQFLQALETVDFNKPMFPANR